MFIKEISLVGFRNYLEAHLSFDKNKTIIIGKNAQGKTNLLEVIQILSLGKSKRARRDAELINHDLESAIIHANAMKINSELSFALQIRPSGKRTCKIDGLSKKTNEMLGHIYTVSFMVDDLEIINSSPNRRRDWIDALVKQLSPSYAQTLNEFEKILKQRNSYLKELIERGMHYSMLSPEHHSQLGIWNSMYINLANQVTTERRQGIAKLQPLVEYFYNQISQDLNSDDISQEILQLEYIGEDLTQELLDVNLPRDFARGFSNVGPHRHDVVININHKLASSFASQGQKRSAILAIKLAELELLKSVIGESPILLLDDVLAELDEDRQDYLLDAIDENTQVIITTTHLGKHLEKWSQDSQILEVEQGRIKTYQT